MLVHDVMTESPTSIRLDKHVRTAVSLLARGKMRHLPVVDANRKLVGVVSRTDLLAAMPSTMDPTVSQVDRETFLGFIPVEKLVRREVATVRPDASIADAARMMREEQINCLPVVRLGELVGIVTTDDLLRVLERVTLAPD